MPTNKQDNNRPTPPPPKGGVWLMIGAVLFTLVFGYFILPILVFVVLPW
jgi:hypothetical protein